MAKTYWLRFGAGDPRTFTGLAPTFLIFSQANGSAVTPPSISENPASSGLYNFTWGTTTSIGFLADAATTSPGAALRYVAGSIDPADRADEYGTTIVAIGTSNIALGTTSVAQGVLEIGLGTTILASNVNQGITIVAIGNSLAALGLSLTVEVAGIGSTASSYGSSSQDPVDLFGYLKRIQENLEGNNSYVKGTGALSILSRGSATLLITKTITNSVTTVIKT